MPIRTYRRAPVAVGIRLIVEVMDHAPTTLTHREAWVLGVLAEDARDETRTTWSSIEAPRILRRARVSRPQMYAVIKALITKGVLKRVSAGQKNAVAKYALLPLAPAQCVDIPDTDAPVQRPDSADTDQPQRPRNPDTERPRQHPEIADTDAAQCPQIPDLSVRESQTPTPQPPRERTNTPAPDDAFDSFWAVYPRKVAKGTARTAWTKALKRGADPALIAAAAARHAAQWHAARTELRFIPYPATWLNGDRYDDAPEPLPPHAQPPRPGTPQRYTDPTERGIF
ncbi:hypothetical protein ACGFRG_07915 [Streptomyces sp. NPDC048696]|uniref:hypothetical protein n=1 Tax=Streptomyces sp. NPDC048696 TaxID=3365585 RepID=UPI00371D768B